jgi:nucleotide-binding universal stress UspA family protein
VQTQAIASHPKHAELTEVPRILVSIDFTEASNRAIAYAALLSKQLRTGLDLLIVWNPSERADEDARQTLFADTPEWRAVARCLAGLQYKNGIDARARLAFGDRCAAIVKVVHEAPFDLIVIGVDERVSAPSIDRQLAHSVARQVACPVVTVRPDTE